MAEIGKEGPQINYDSDPVGGGAGPEAGEGEGRDPRERYWSSGLLEKITSERLTRTPEQLRWRTWKLLEGVVDRQDDWTARIMRDRMGAALEQMEEAREPDLTEYLGGVPEEVSPSEELYKEFKKMNEEANAFLTLFIDFGNFYEKMAPRSVNLSKVAFGNEILELNPETVLRPVFSLRGFKEEEGWPSIGDQIDTTIRAYTFLAAQSEERKREELDWIMYQDRVKEGGGKEEDGKDKEKESTRELSEGFKQLFPGEGSEKDARDWLRRLKLKVFVLSESKLRPKIKGKTLEELEKESPEVLEEVDKEPVFNRFSTPLTIPARDAIDEAIEELASRGRSGDFLMDTQSRIAVKLGRKIFYYFGLASYFGGEISFKDSGEVDDVFAEGHPWADGFLDTLDSEARVAYNIDRGYWPGPKPFRENAPKRMHTHYFRYANGKDPAERDNKAKNKSLWYEIWKEGKKMGVLSWDLMADYSLKSYWIRYVFLYMEDVGVMPAFMGTPWIDNPDLLLKTKFWKDVRKSISVAVREHLVVEGDYQGWVEEHRSGLERRRDELLGTDPEGKYEKINDKKERAHVAWKDAIKQEMEEEDNAIKRRWKNIILGSVNDWWEVKGSAFLKGVKDAYVRAGFMKN